MNDEQYLDYCRQQLTDFTGTLAHRTQMLADNDSLRELAEAFQRLATATEADFYGEAGRLVDRLFTTYPDFAPTFPRELLWFFGGDCLHFMPDEEIALYQQLDELRNAAAARGEIFDLREARAKLLKLQ